MPAFDVVIPSLPGYAFSSRPPRPFNYRDDARLWRALMSALGYGRYAAAGGDFGAGVSTFLALDDPAKVLGLLLWTVELGPPVPAPASLSDAEREYLVGVEAWRQLEGGYKAIQSTRPQTLGYGLNDSPAGLAAWVLEKWRAWSDCAGDLERHFSRDFLLTLLTVYWVSSSITTSLRDYFDNRWSPSELNPADRVEVPTAFCLFPHQTAAEPLAPRSWLDRLYNIERWTVAERGGHFAPVEDPGRLASEIRAHFGGPTPGRMTAARRSTRM
jgi:pimeloyl-ACP methyl ester carboxylesterase